MKREELSGMLSKVDRESASFFADEIDEIRRGDKNSGRAKISEQLKAEDLPLMICMRMYELLTAPAVRREEYNDVIKEAKIVFSAHMSEIETAQGLFSV